MDKTFCIHLHLLLANQCTVGTSHHVLNSFGKYGTAVDCYTLQLLSKPYRIQCLISIKYFKSINTSAGGGAFNYEEEFESLGIDEEVLNKLGGEKKLKFIEAVNVKGDSMEPVIKDSDIIFIDKSSTNPSHDKYDVYVVNTPNGILVKIVTTLPSYEKFQLQSYNELYPPEIYDSEDITVVGKVVGVSSL